MKCARYFLFVFFLFCGLPAVSQTEQLQETSSSIRSKLIDLKKNSAVVTEQLKTLSESLQQSQQEAKQWKETSIQLSDSLMNINEQLNDCYSTIEKQTLRLNTRAKVIAALLIILIIRTCLMICGYIIYAKGIRLPRWLDILL